MRGQGDDTRCASGRTRVRRGAVRTGWSPGRLRAERWLERHHDEQFFLYVDTWDPHEPWDAPEYYTRKYREDYDGEQIYPAYGNWKKAGIQKDDVDLGHATYCGEVTMVDFWIKALLASWTRWACARTRSSCSLPTTASTSGSTTTSARPSGCTTRRRDQRDSSLPEWLRNPGCSRSSVPPLYKELTNIPLIVRGPGLEPGRSRAMTTAPDIAPTIMDLVGLGGVPTTMTGDSFGGVLEGTREEHRSLVVSSWPLYLAKEVRSSRPSTPRRAGSTTTCRSP